MNQIPLRFSRLLLAASSLCGGGMVASGQTAHLVDQPYRVAEVLHADVIRPGLALWRAELHEGGKVAEADGGLEVDVPAGATVWFRPVLEGPVLIRYDATVIDAGGPNDRVSDLNCFWMATDSRSVVVPVEAGDGFFEVQERDGSFPSYHELRCYYVGLGGADNGTTRFRRYIGDPDERPLLPEHDLPPEPGVLIEANRTDRIELVAFHDLVQYWRNGEVLYEVYDLDPYTRGRFALRTVKNHLKIENFSVHRLEAAAAGSAMGGE